MKFLKALLLSAFSFAATLVAGDITVVKDGNLAGNVYILRNSPPGVRVAAQELREHVMKMTGVAMPEEYQSGVIVIGTATSGIIPKEVRDRLKGKKPEAYMLKTLNGKLYIVGATQIGALYGVYALLRDYQGIRWFMPGEEYVPIKTTVSFPEMDVLSEPAFQFRILSQTGANGPATQSHIWAARNMLQSDFCVSLLTGNWPDSLRDFYEARIVPGTMIGAGGHGTFYDALPPKKYMETHPEYFAMVNEKRNVIDSIYETHYCLSSLEVQRLVADHIISLFDKYGDNMVYLFGNVDSTRGWCECPACIALDQNDSDHARRYHTVVQKIAGMVYAKHPNAKIELWAYADYQKIPEGVKIDPRMTIYYCSHSRCFAHVLEDPSCPRNVAELKKIKAWQALTGKLHLYEYPTCTPMSWSPLEKVFAADMKTYRKLGFLGTKTEISYPDADFPPLPFDEKPYAGIYMMRQGWLYFIVAGRLLWDPDLDVNKVIADFESKYYGRTYPSMKLFNDLRRSNWDKASGCFGFPFGDDRTPRTLQEPGVREKMESLLVEAGKLAGDDPVLQRRILRDKQMFKNFIVKPCEKYQSKLSSIIYAPEVKTAPVIDGKGDDPVWKEAFHINNFKKAYTYKPGPPPEDAATDAFICMDKENIYLLIRAKEPFMKNVKAKFDNGGDMWGDDGFEIFIDPRNIANVFYQVIVNTKGCVTALQQPGSKKINLDVQAVSVCEADGYVIEVKIPVKKMEGEFLSGRQWGLHIGRNRTMEEAKVFGCFSLEGEEYHKRTGYSTMVIGKNKE